MATPAPALIPKSFSVAKPLKIGGRKILAGSATVQLLADPQIVQALQSNSKLPLDLDPIRLAQVKLGLATGDRSVDFAGGAGKVSFSAAAGVQTGLGVYVKPSDMLDDIAKLTEGDPAGETPFDQVPFPDVDAARYFAFYWGYNLDVGASGSVALAPGAAVTFGAQGSRRRAFSIIRAHATNPRAGTAIRELLQKSWQLPSQITSVDDLQPGTWVLSEVAGSFSASVGVNVGYDYNWIRSVKIGSKPVLEGDIGLKIQAGVSAAFGFNASGRYLVVVGRESLDKNDKTVRVRLTRLKQRGFDFAFHANLDVETTTGDLLPEQLDDFVAAVLGVHGLQTLQEVRRWTDPSKRLSELASEFLVDFARNQLGEDFEQKFDEVRDKVLAWFEKWDELPATANSALWDAVRLDDQQLKEFVAKIEEFANPDTVGTALRVLIADVSFASTPIGRWLVSAAETRAVNIISNRPEVEKVRRAAQTTLDILNGKMLQELKSFVENKVGFPKIREAVEKNDLDSLSDLAKKRLERFLGKEGGLNNEDFEKVRTTVNRLLTRGSELYEAGVKALNDTYKFSFDYTYSKTTTKTALLDASFDFSKNNPNLGALLQKAIAGDFRAVLPGPGRPSPAGVTFAEAALSHHIQRQAHVKLSLPFLDQETIHTTSSFADYKLLSEDGNLYFYSLDASDELQRVGKWESTLSVGLSLTAGLNSEIRRYDRNGSPATIDYRFVQAVPAMRTAQLERLMVPLSKLYFPTQFGGASGVDKPSVHEWALALDKVVDEQPAAEDGLIGNTMLSLDASLPGEVLLKWLQAPEDLDDPVYMEMSRRFQTLLRRFIPFVYFLDAERYRDLGAAQPLLVYSSLPVTTSVKLVAGGVQLNTNQDLYWNWPDDSDAGERRALIFSALTHERLTAAMNEAVRVLGSDPRLRKRAKRYDPDKNLDSARATVLSGAGRTLLESLLFTEATLIRSAAKAGRDLAQFRGAVADPEKAVKELAQFGDKFTRTFNAKLKSVFKPKEPGSRQLLRNLGLLMFADVTKALEPGLDVDATARLEVAVFKTDAEFEPARLLAGEPVAEGQLSLRQPILEAGTTS